MRAFLAFLTLGLLVLPTLRAEPRQVLDLAALLEAYAAGRHEETVKVMATAGDEAGRALRLDWPVAGRRWIDATPEGRRGRMLVAASLALESEHIRAERGDWTPLPNVCASYRQLVVAMPGGKIGRAHV